MLLLAASTARCRVGTVARQDCRQADRQAGRQAGRQAIPRGREKFGSSGRSGNGRTATAWTKKEARDGLFAGTLS